METNIPGNGPDLGEILENTDRGIFIYSRRGCEYLVKIPSDNCKYHLLDTIPINHDEGAS